MSWKPDARQMELLVEYRKAPPERIAAALGITEAELAAFAGRLAATRVVVDTKPATRIRKSPEALGHGTVPIRAARLFERDDTIRERCWRLPDDLR